MQRTSRILALVAGATMAVGAFTGTASAGNNFDPDLEPCFSLDIEDCSPADEPTDEATPEDDGPDAPPADPDPETGGLDVPAADPADAVSGSPTFTG